ncbi:uncharacterized protein LOC129925234 [Biomphalaria glabrata]|uniref:Uncharacterized protein LOC129925234 n=1 Tax=Biomphalaria glabrata TaxID=6526 RepID=A0A9W2ZZN7_BIOGL|nr:uncharacterized protein LOC129925234 [Biomphalaria glabrata]XP_055880472.1 uncharacterized protein LOC129925234 [Biomphalaria glabrata]
MLQHVQNIERKASEKLALLRKLASTKWGAKADMLRTLYLGAVRSQIEYSYTVQDYASKTALESLDRVQAQALRFICGTFRTSPTNAAEILTNVAPLHLRRERAVLTAYERYKRGDSRLPTSILVRQWRERNHIKMRSFLHIAANLSKSAGLSTDRIPIRRISTCPPWRRFPAPQINLSLIGQEGATKRRLTPAILQNLASITIKSYPSDAIFCYTDGSVLRDPDRSGYGALIVYPNQIEPDRLSGPCGYAELTGITRAFEAIRARMLQRETSTTTVVLVTDSRSSLQAMGGGGGGLPVIEEAIGAADNIRRAIGAVVFIQWGPLHCGVKGNETADALAREGAMAATHLEAPSTYLQATAQIRALIREKWLNRMRHPDRDDPWWRLRRSEQSIFAQCRTEHCPIWAYFARFRTNFDSRCRHCGESVETVSHVLYECPQLRELRGDLPVQSLDLYGSYEALRRTAKFLARALRED